MKKIVLSLVVMSTLLICSCNFSKKASNASETSADSLNVQPTEVVDSVVVADTVAVDSVVAE